MAYDEDGNLPLNHRTDAEILSLAEDIAEESDVVSLGDEPRIVRAEDGRTARVAAWLMVHCGQFEVPAHEV